MDARQAVVSSKLLIQWRKKKLTLDLVEGVELVVGCRADGLLVDGPYVSAKHLKIVADDQYFVMVDTSTNGTFVQTEDEKITFLRRNSLRLWGRGWMSLGESPTKENALRFEHIE